MRVYCGNLELVDYCAIFTTSCILGTMSTETQENIIPTTESFGARLALIRWQMGWNLKEAALACNLRQQSWREWEIHGRRPHDLDKVAAQISARTGVDDYWIMTGKEKHPSGDPQGGATPATGAGRKPPITTGKRERTYATVSYLTGSPAEQAAA